MSQGDKRDVQTPSTVEAIRMASASILGTTTSRGYPLGSATGSGSMMEENSETVAMNVTPLIFSLREALLASENLNLLSLEWDLESSPGPEVLPETLIIAGGISEDVASYICALSWEKGVIDPFKMDTYINNIAKKISDIEKAVIGNDLPYETEGLRILKRFSDRFNGVTFVEMLDRQFQESWDTQKLKTDNVDVEAVLRYKYRDDFSSNPPGPKIQKRTSVEFKLPSSDEEGKLKHFRHRLISPQGLDAITSRIPDMGREILSELNEFAYSIEEVDIARTTIAAFTEFLGKDEIQVGEVENLTTLSPKFVEKMNIVTQVFGDVIEAHATSGAKMTLDTHKETISNNITSRTSEMESLQVGYAKALLEHMMNSIKREFPITDEIRAWELKATFSYFLSFTKRVLGYIAQDLDQFLLITGVRKVMRGILQTFREESEAEGMAPTELLVFRKFYAELYSLLTAIIDRKSFEEYGASRIETLVESITRDISDEFKKIELWDLIDFTDLAEIARIELENYKSETGVTKETLVALLERFDTFVNETLPDVGDTLLSKDVFVKAIDEYESGSQDLPTFFRTLVSQETEKPDEWRNEANLWVVELSTKMEEAMPFSSQLHAFLELAYDRLGEGATPESVLERIRSATERFELEYKNEVTEWEKICGQIDQENLPIKENNAKHSELVAEAIRKYEKEKKIYEEGLTAYHQLMSEYESQLSPTDKLKPIEPIQPESLESRKMKIDSEYPEKTEKPHPPKPEPSQEMSSYTALRDILDNKLNNMKRSQLQMEQVFTLKLRALKSEGASIAEDISIGISTEFLEYLMNASLRKLGRLLPRAKRAYLRDPDDSNLVYLVSFEFLEEDLLVSVGSNLLRRE
ncbi:MAG: hypothetical protein KAR33_04040 [Candidatus Thorarchaeota archaeon]|nr:hypothetical protein [Candidatus Thorarchaeota archaeon]